VHEAEPLALHVAHDGSQTTGGGGGGATTPDPLEFEVETPLELLTETVFPVTVVAVVVVEVVV
jgi:hypothetical protein